jgi:hypothetical protein
MINAVEAEAGKPVPQLMYGRYNGKNIYIPGSGSCDIPEGGIYLDLSDHSSPDSKFGYHVWIRNNAGTLELSATTDDIARTDGISHKSGDTGYRYLGDVYPVAIHTGHYGPVFCQDRLLVANLLNKKKVLVGKKCPESGYAVRTWSYQPLGEKLYRTTEDEYFADILLLEDHVLSVYFVTGVYIPGGGADYVHLIIAPEPGPFASTVNQTLATAHANDGVRGENNMFFQVGLVSGKSSVGPWIVADGTCQVFFMRPDALGNQDWYGLTTKWWGEVEL